MFSKHLTHSDTNQLGRLLLSLQLYKNFLGGKESFMSHFKRYMDFTCPVLIFYDCSHPAQKMSFNSINQYNLHTFPVITRGSLDFDMARVWPFWGDHRFSPKSTNYFIIELKEIILMQCSYFCLRT